jgi:thioesterase domain-containing protein
MTKKEAIAQARSEITSTSFYLYPGRRQVHTWSESDRSWWQWNTTYTPSEARSRISDWKKERVKELQT